MAVRTPPRQGGGLDLLSVTPERFRRTLWRTFLRHGITADLDTAVHAAMTVFGPVLEAMDAEILRLREAVTGMESPARPGRSAAGGRGRPVAAQARQVSGAPPL